MASTECLGADAVMAFIDGHAVDLVREEIDRHLDRCPDCRALVLGAGAQSTSRDRQSDLAGRFGLALTFRPGTIVGGRYRIERLLGRGGMGEVYVADDIQLGTRVALKAVSALVADQPRIVTRIKHEVLLARQVTHPSVCRVFDFGVHESVPFLTMELLEGETLGARLRRTGPMPTTAALPIAEQLVGALEAAHAAGVIHRDFKSDNVILLQADRGYTRAVVTDFGLARAQSNRVAATEAQDSSRGRLIGTLSYMAPEQIDGGPVTPATDIYALGVVLFEMVTGRLPFAGSSTIEGALRRLTERPVSPRAIVPSLRPAWDAAILRCLERQPTRRFACLDDVRRALEWNRPAWSMRPRFKTLFVASALALVASAIGRLLHSGARRELPSIPAPARSLSVGGPTDKPRQPARTAMLRIGAERRDARADRARRGGHHLRLSVSAGNLDSGPPAETGQAARSPARTVTDELLDPRDDDVIDPYQPQESR